MTLPTQIAPPPVFEERRGSDELAFNVYNHQAYEPLDESHAHTYTGNGPADVVIDIRFDCRRRARS